MTTKEIIISLWDCPDCADNDELVKMERHEWPVGGATVKNSLTVPTKKAVKEGEENGTT